MQKGPPAIAQLEPVWVSVERYGKKNAMLKSFIVENIDQPSFIDQPSSSTALPSVSLPNWNIRNSALLTWY
jgi:hypothetical protein